MDETPTFTPIGRGLTIRAGRLRRLTRLSPLLKVALQNQTGDEPGNGGTEADRFRLEDRIAEHGQQHSAGSGKPKHRSSESRIEGGRTACEETLSLSQPNVRRTKAPDRSAELDREPAQLSGKAANDRETAVPEDAAQPCTASRVQRETGSLTLSP